jgi:hypothetical protein
MAADHVMAWWFYRDVGYVSRYGVVAWEGGAVTAHDSDMVELKVRSRQSNWTRSRPATGHAVDQQLDTQ